MTLISTLVINMVWRLLGEGLVIFALCLSAFGFGRWSKIRNNQNSSTYFLRRRMIIKELRSTLLKWNETAQLSAVDSIVKVECFCTDSMPPSNMTSQAPPFGSYGYHSIQTAYQQGPVPQPNASPSHNVYGQPGYQQYSQVRVNSLGRFWCSILWHV